MPMVPSSNLGSRPIPAPTRRLATFAAWATGAAWLALAAAAGGAAQQPADTAAEAERRAVEELVRRGVQPPPPEERRRLIENFFPSLGRVTLDTAPLAFEVAGVRLVVPANYVSSTHRDAEGQPTLVLHALLPGMEGATRANMACVRVAPNCADYVRILVNVPRRPVAREVLGNVLRLWPDQVRRPGPPGGAEEPWRGQASDGSGLLYFRAERPADDQDILARCSVHAGGVRGGCVATDNRMAGLAFSYVFSGQQVEHLVRLDDQVRSLIARFLR